MKRYKGLILISIFVIALIFRFYAFKESVYFAFDQARDGYVSRDIYLNKNLRFIGPPISGNIGLFHGVLFWYLIGPLNLLFSGDPILMSAVFRILNALGVFLVFAIANKMFNSRVAMLSALFFAVSFEETQYSMYVGNPSLAVLAILLIFFAATLLLKKDKKAKWSPILMFGGAAIATQFNLMYVYTLFVVLLILFLFREQSLKIKIKYYIGAFLAIILLLSTYILAEIKYGFRSIKLAVSLFKQGYGILNPNESKYLLFWGKYLRMFKDNILGLIGNDVIIGIIALVLTTWLFVKAKKDKKYSLLLIWILSWVILMVIGGHLAYYTNAGLGVGILILVAVILEKIFKSNKWLALILIFLIFWGNAKQVIYQSPKSSIVEIQPQLMMKLSDEYKLIDEMYQQANGNGFTVRMTGIPYKIQTVWAYLFSFYGERKYSYLPYWETGNVLDFPGELPVPQKGTTCLRFRVVEPTRGLPQNLIDDDIKTENYFSTSIKQINIGHFLLETRQANDKNCHNNRPI